MKNKKILLIFTSFLFLSIFIQTVLAEDLKMNACFIYSRNNTFSIKSFKVYVGKISPEYEPPNSKYTLKILDYSSEVLFTRRLAISFFNPITNTIQETGESCYELPYYEKANKLKIFYEDKEIFSIDLNKELCNSNGICDLGENGFNCPADCKKPMNIPWLYIVLSVVSVAAIIIVLLYKKSRSAPKADWQKLKEKWK